MNKLLIFDLDGTLIDSRQDIAVSLNYALSECGLDPLPQERIEEMVGWGAERLVKDAIGTNKIEDLQAVFMAFWKHYDENLLNQTKLYPGAVEFMKSLPNWRKAVVTNKPQGFSEKTLAGLQLEHFFEWVIGADKLPGILKPDARVLGPIQEAMGEWTEAIMIGDSVVDIELAKNAEITSCILTHGFGKLEELKMAKPDYLVDSFLELSQLSLFTK